MSAHAEYAPLQGIPCQYVSLYAHVYSTLLLLQSIILIYHLALLSRIRWGCLYEEFVERTKVFCVHKHVSVNKAFVHTKTWWSAQKMRGVDSYSAHSLRGTLRDCSVVQNVSWDGPNEAFARCLCAPRRIFAQSLRTTPDVYASMWCTWALLSMQTTFASSLVYIAFRSFSVTF